MTVTIKLGRLDVSWLPDKVFVHGNVFHGARKYRWNGWQYEEADP